MDIETSFELTHQLGHLHRVFWRMACHGGTAGLAKSSFHETAVVQAGGMLAYLMISYSIVSFTRFGLQMSCGCTDECAGMPVKQVNHEHSLIPSSAVHGFECLACKECRQLAPCHSAHYTASAVNGVKEILDSNIRMEAVLSRITLRLSTKVKAVRAIEESTAITWSAILLSR